MSKKIHAYRLFFPAACLHAAIAVPLSVYAITSGALWPPGLAGFGHAFEMLFGFALALVAGYTLGPLPRGKLIALLTLWLAARFMIAAPLAFSSFAYFLNALFAIALAWQVIPGFLAAKKWRNRIIIPLLIGLCILPAAYTVASFSESAAQRQHILLLQAVVLFALLMVFIGGRIIASAAMGESGRYGSSPAVRLQPRMEATLIILLLAAALTLLFPQGWPIAGALCVLAGLFVSIRLWRWRLWQYRLRPDLICLGIGYGWLALGLVAYGITIIYNAWQTTALHIITIGALGTLSAGVMARLHAQHVYRQSPPAHIVISATMLISAATLARLAATINPEITIPLLWTAASAWSLTYLLLAAYLSSRPATRAG